MSGTARSPPDTLPAPGLVIDFGTTFFWYPGSFHSRAVPPPAALRPMPSSMYAVSFSFSASVSFDQPVSNSR